MPHSAAWSPPTSSSATAAPVTLGWDQELDIGDVVSGFRCAVRDIFE